MWLPLHPWLPLRCYHTVVVRWVGGAVSGLESRTQFHVLGPLSVQANGSEAAVPAPRSRVVLAMLLLHAGRTVTLDQLAEAAWSTAPPGSARNQIQTCVSQLRRRLTEPGQPGISIVTEPAGYRLQIDPEQVDVYRFRRLVAEARRAVAAGLDQQAREHYRSAVGLWRGPALAGIDNDLVRELADALDEERAQALEECLEVELALGGAGELVGELTELVHRYPYRERLHGALMRALYRAGRPADALAAYRQARTMFQDELGTDPGEDLQRLHQAILSRDPELLTVAAPASPALPGLRELPVEASCFVGREAELARLLNILLPPDRTAPRRPPLAVLYGPGGTGKSALAVRAAHELADQFPDGQLYVDLCGSTPGIRPLPAIEVLGRFLRRLGVHPSEVPSGEAEAAALFRSRTADRQLLLVLDNAVDKDQVAALLPGTPTCAVLITSRHPLPTLDADDRIRLAALPDADALTLLSELTGRQSAEPAAAKEIVSLCGGLPLALRVAAGRLAARPDLTAAEYARRLADRSRRLDELQLDDLAVRASIRTSYDALLTGGGPSGQLAARAFRMLGLLQVPDVAPPVVAAMLVEPAPETARDALDRLVDAQLVEPVPGARYRLHDLVRLVAAERASAEDTDSDRDDSLYRAVAFYTGGVWRAGVTMHRLRAAMFGSPPPLDGIRLPAFASILDASTWGGVEHASLEAVHNAVVARGEVASDLAVWLSYALWNVLDLRCEWRSAIQVSRQAIQGARSRGDRRLEALGLLLHGRSMANQGSYDEAVSLLERSLEVMREVSNQPGVAVVLNGIGVVYERRGDSALALSYYEAALKATHDQDLTGLLLSIQSNIVVCLTVLGRLHHAVELGERVVIDCVAAGDVVAHAIIKNNLAAAYSLSGDQARALRCADQAIELSQMTGDQLAAFEGSLMRSEANRQLGRRREALSDAERARSFAEIARHRYGVAAAERQRQRVLDTLEPTADTVAWDATMRDTPAVQAGSAFRDPMVELILARDTGFPARQRGSLLDLSRSASPPESAVDSAFDQGGDPS